MTGQDQESVPGNYGATHRDRGPATTAANTPQTPMTEGQWRVGLDFNPSGDPRVREIKELSAALIDRMLDISTNRNHPGARNAAMAATQYEDAAMNAVKAITKKPR